MSESKVVLNGCCEKIWQEIRGNMPLAIANVIIWMAVFAKFLFPSACFSIIFNVAVAMVATPMACYKGEYPLRWGLAASAMGILGIFL